MKANSILALLVLQISIASCSENRTSAQTNTRSEHARVGGDCEGCEAIYENTTSFNNLDWQLTLPGYDQKGPKLHISGTVYKADGNTPAAGIILYIYHTDQSGIYPQRGNEKGWARRHGYIRGWIKTNSNGQYSIRTLRPGTYPNRGAAAHIHCIVKEDKLNEYYIGDFLFDDDPLLTSRERSPDTPGGNGVLKLDDRDGILYSTRDIYLGKNILNYPQLH
jgi:protocatechuate 3,4-dioxygenase beta subunit